MTRKAWRRQKNMPVRLMSTTFCQSASVRSSSSTPGGALVPALLNSTSTRPNFCTAASNSATTEACLRHIGRHRQRALRRLPDKAATSCSGCSRRPASTTCQPSASKASAAALPMPEPAPVTSATLMVSVMLFK